MLAYLVLVTDDLDTVFKALADGGRRHLLDRLRRENGQSLGALASSLAMSRQAVSQHLAVLESANLVTVVRNGREKLHYLNPVPILQIADRWIAPFETARLRALAELKKTVEGEGADEA
jgi:DNA-binding transcriptional ArsR family regulator